MDLNHHAPNDISSSFHQSSNKFQLLHVINSSSDQQSNLPSGPPSHERGHSHWAWCLCCWTPEDLHRRRWLGTAWWYQTGGHGWPQSPSWYGNRLEEDIIRADFRFAPNQWEMALLWYDVSHWLGASLESALYNVRSTHWDPAIFHKYCCFTKHGVLWQIWLGEVLGVHFWYVKILQCGYMEHGLKDVAFHVQKHIALWAICYNPPANLQHATRGTHICGTRCCNYFSMPWSQLTHWGQVMHTWVSKLTIIGSDNGLALARHQAIIWTIAGILLFGPVGTNFSEILLEIYTFLFKKMYSEM